MTGSLGSALRSTLALLCLLGASLTFADALQQHGRSLKAKAKDKETKDTPIAGFHLNGYQPEGSSTSGRKLLKTKRKHKAKRRRGRGYDKVTFEISDRFASYLEKEPEFLTRLAYIGTAERDEVKGICRRVAKGKTKFSTDLEVDKGEGSIGTGDDIAYSKVDHQFGCTVTRGPKVKLNPGFDSGEVFALIEFGKRSNIIDCAQDEERCNVWTILDDEDVEELIDEAEDQDWDRKDWKGRKMLWEREEQVLGHTRLLRAKQQPPPRPTSQAPTDKPDKSSEKSGDKSKPTLTSPAIPGDKVSLTGKMGDGTGSKSIASDEASSGSVSGSGSSSSSYGGRARTESMINPDDAGEGEAEEMGKPAWKPGVKPGGTIPDTVGGLKDVGIKGAVGAEVKNAFGAKSAIAGAKASDSTASTASTTQPKPADEKARQAAIAKGMADPAFQEANKDFFGGKKPDDKDKGGPGSGKGGLGGAIVVGGN